MLGEKSKLRYSNNSLIAFSEKDNENGVKGGTILKYMDKEFSRTEENLELIIINTKIYDNLLMTKISESFSF